MSGFNKPQTVLVFYTFAGSWDISVQANFTEIRCKHHNYKTLIVYRGDLVQKSVPRERYRKPIHLNTHFQHSVRSGLWCTHYTVKLKHT